MAEISLQGKTALVTGASSGLGADFARNLAGRGCNLVLVARREDFLNKIQQEIQAQHQVEIQIIAMDLTEQGAPQALYDRLQQSGKSVDVLINNAGYGLYGDFLSIPWEREKNMLELDILVLTELTKLFVGDMVVRKFGYVLLLSSIGAYQPSPTYATYSAAKSYVLSFGEALNYELRQTGVKCTVLSPGVTATEFLQVAGQKASRYQRMVMMTSPQVTKIGIESMLKGTPSIVPGFLNAITVMSNRLVPRSFSAALAHRLMASSK